MSTQGSLESGHVLVFAEGIVSPPGEPSVLMEGTAALRALASQSQICRLNPSGKSSVPEEMMLGLPPRSVRLASGPLYLSAMGVDPPERSVQYVLSWLSVSDDGVLAMPDQAPSREESELLREALPRLGTKRLIPVFGEGLEHALVWEDGSIEQGTTPPEQAIGKPMTEVLPQGDGEPMLRQFIDDSINLLSELEFNRRRIGDGLRPLNALWMWGQGFRGSLPNLALRRGWPAVFVSESKRLRGLARLSGYGSSPGRLLRQGVMPRLGGMFDAAKGQGIRVVDVPGLAQMRALNRLEALEESLSVLSQAFAEPLLGIPRASRTALTLLFTSPDHEGLALMHRPSELPLLDRPFDERLMDDRAVPVKNAWELTAEILGSATMGQ